jgi:hypothetical protein
MYELADHLKEADFLSRLRGVPYWAKIPMHVG